MKKVKTYRPYTWEERDQLRGKWVKYVIFGGNHEMFINLTNIRPFWVPRRHAVRCVGGRGRRMTTDAINQAMSNYATAIDPCGMCRHREHTNVTEICGQCCYYWGSKFELDTRRQGKKNGVRHE